MTTVLFVCLGNICRSPTAEAVFRKLAQEAGLAAACDSAGTGDWHAGEAPHPPSVKAAARRGYDLSGLRARQVLPADFSDFDLILAMDRSNLADLRQMAANLPYAAQPQLFLDYAPQTGRKDMPDPWYSGEYDLVLDLVEAGSRGLIEALKTQTPRG